MYYNIVLKSVVCFHTLEGPGLDFISPGDSRLIPYLLANRHRVKSRRLASADSK